MLVNVVILYGIVEYLIKEQCLNPLLRDHDHNDSLDYALSCNKIDIVVYICQYYISSDEMLNPNRIKTTINLIKHIIIKSNPYDPKWITADGDDILQLVGSSRLLISLMPSAVVFEILETGIVTLHIHWRTADGNNLLELLCQSSIYLSHIPQPHF